LGNVDREHVAERLDHAGGEMEALEANPAPEIQAPGDGGQPVGRHRRPVDEPRRLVSFVALVAHVQRGEHRGWCGAGGRDQDPLRGRDQQEGGIAGSQAEPGQVAEVLGPADGGRGEGLLREKALDAGKSRAQRADQGRVHGVSSRYP
jgi:hypothetical protein